MQEPTGFHKMMKDFFTPSRAEVTSVRSYLLVNCDLSIWNLVPVHHATHEREIQSP